MKTLNRKQFLATSLALAGAAGLAACTPRQESESAPKTEEKKSEYTLVKEGTVIAVSDLAFPPLDFVPDGKTDPEGFEVDVLQAMVEKLGLKLEWLPPTKFDTIVSLIKMGGKADVGASAFTITDERKQEIDFTDPYVDSNQGLVVKADSKKDTQQALNVKGVKVAVQAGSTGEAWAKENLPEAEIVPLDDVVQSMTGLSAGLYDAVSADLPVVSYLCKNSYTDCKVALEIPTGEQYGFVVAKTNTKLTEDLNTALKEIQADGTIEALEQKWFGQTL